MTGGVPDWRGDPPVGGGGGGSEGSVRTTYAGSAQSGVRRRTNPEYFTKGVPATKTHDGGNHLLNGGSFHCLFNREKAFHGLSCNTKRQQGHDIPLHIHTEAPCTAMQRLEAAKMVFFTSTIAR